MLACSRLSVSGGLKKRAGDEWGLVGKKELAADPALRPLAFSIVQTDREPGTGYLNASMLTDLECSILIFLPWDSAQSLILHQVKCIFQIRLEMFLSFETERSKQTTKGRVALEHQPTVCQVP